MWNRELVDRPEAYADALDRWLAYYRELGIERLGYACLVLRKRADGRDGWVEALQLPRSALRPAGRHVSGSSRRTTAWPGWPPAAPCSTGDCASSTTRS